MTLVLINQHGADRVFAGHPWVFKSDVISTVGANPGDVVPVFLERPKQFLGQAFYNPKSQITLRFITHRQETIDRAFWKKRLEAAIRSRPKAFEKEGACRLVFSEADFLPGLIIDRYGEVLVLQTLSLGQDRLKAMWVELLAELFKPKAIIERNEPASRILEGLQKQKGVLFGELPGALEIQEGEKHLFVDVLEGHKTGLYLDQSENHIAARRYAKGRLLDLFAYHGGFAVQLADVTEEIIAIDSSAPALAMAKKNLERNKIENVKLIEANVFDHLRNLEKERERFDTVVLDPPPFVASRKDIEGGRRGYKEINLRAMKLLKPGGVLITCSCSQNFNEAMFYEMLFDAALDAQRMVQVLEKRGAASDHPVLLTFPESYYLQCWILRV